ncbi:MAG: flagellar assembly protein FliW [Alphaproteobacteria bacterium]
MLENNPNLAESDGNPPAGPSELEDAVTIDTQFGPMTFTRDQVIRFPTGLLGFGGVSEFGIGDLPDPAYGNFKLMKSLDDSGLSFLVLPLEALPDHIHEDDLKQAREALAIDPEDASVMLIVTVHKGEEKATLTVNLRAPVLIDTKLRTAVQHVLPNAAYPIRHEI